MKKINIKFLILCCFFMIMPLTGCALQNTLSENRSESTIPSNVVFNLPENLRDYFTKATITFTHSAYKDRLSYDKWKQLIDPISISILVPNKMYCEDFDSGGASVTEFAYDNPETERYSSMRIHGLYEISDTIPFNENIDSYFYASASGEVDTAEYSKGIKIKTLSGNDGILYYDNRNACSLYLRIDDYFTIISFGIEDDENILPYIIQSINIVK